MMITTRQHNFNTQQAINQFQHSVNTLTPPFSSFTTPYQHSKLSSHQHDSSSTTHSSAGVQLFSTSTGTVRTFKAYLENLKNVKSEYSHVLPLAFSSFSSTFSLEFPDIMLDGNQFVAFSVIQIFLFATKICEKCYKISSLLLRNKENVFGRHFVTISCKDVGFFCSRCSLSLQLAENGQNPPHFSIHQHVIIPTHHTHTHTRTRHLPTPRGSSHRFPLRRSSPGCYH